jgi:hypothetical protein
MLRKQVDADNPMRPRIPPKLQKPVRERLASNRNVLILDEDLVGQNVRHLLRDGRHRAAPTEEEIEPFADCARHRSLSLGQISRKRISMRNIERCAQARSADRP